MKKHLSPLSALVPLLLLAGCTGLGFPRDESWASGEMNEIKGSVKIVSVSVDRSGERTSLEKEISDLLPLFFSEESWLVVSSDAPNYLATVHAREREFPDGWRTRRSVSVELRLWAAGSIAGDAVENIDGTLPLSAGRSLVQGNKSLASSSNLSTMLRKAVKNAVSGIPGGYKR